MLHRYWRRFVVVVSTFSVMLGVLVSPVSASPCNPSGTGTDVDMHLETFNYGSDSSVEFRAATVNIDFGGVHVKQGSSAWFYIQLLDNHNGGYVRAGVRVIQGSSGKHYYRYYKVVDKTGATRYLENDVEEVDVSDIDTGYFTVRAFPQWNGGWQYEMISASDSSPDGIPDLVFMNALDGGIFKPNVVNFFWDTYNTETQWFGQATDRLWVRSWGYSTNYGSGTLDPSPVWVAGPYGMTWPKWAKNASGDISVWDTRC